MPTNTLRFEKSYKYSVQDTKDQLFYKTDKLGNKFAKTPAELADPHLKKQIELFNADPERYSQLNSMFKKTEHKMTILRAETVAQSSTDKPVLAMKLPGNLTFITRGEGQGGGGSITFPQGMETMTSAQIKELMFFLHINGISGFDFSGLNEKLKKQLEVEIDKDNGLILWPTHESEYESKKLIKDNEAKLSKELRQNLHGIERYVTQWFETSGKVRGETYTYNFDLVRNRSEFAFYKGEIKDSDGNIKEPLFTISLQSEIYKGKESLVIGFSVKDGEMLKEYDLEKIIEALKGQGCTHVDLSYLSSSGNAGNRSTLRKMAAKHGLVVVGVKVTRDHYRGMREEARKQLWPSEFIKWEAEQAKELEVDKNAKKQGDFVDSVSGGARFLDFSDHFDKYIIKDIRDNNTANDGIKTAAAASAAADVLYMIKNARTFDPSTGKDSKYPLTTFIKDRESDVRFAEALKIMKEYEDKPDATFRSLSNQDITKVYETLRNYREKEIETALNKNLEQLERENTPYKDKQILMSQYLNSHITQGMNTLREAQSIVKNNYDVGLEGVGINNRMTYKLTEKSNSQNTQYYRQQNQRP